MRKKLGQSFTFFILYCSNYNNTWVYKDKKWIINGERLHIVKPVIDFGNIALNHPAAPTRLNLEITNNHVK